MTGFVDPKLLIRRINITANKVMDEDKAKENEGYEQMELFTDYTMADEKKSAMDEKIKKERKLQEAMLSVKKRYGKNAMLKGMNLEEGATAIQRNDQIGGTGHNMFKKDESWKKYSDIIDLPHHVSTNIHICHLRTGRTVFAVCCTYRA